MRNIKSFCLVLGCLAASFSAPGETRPNIVMLFADDWGRHASIYAKLDGPVSVNDVIETPVFDELAQSGVLFNNAFVSAPSCTPCRSALLSGQHFWRTKRGAFLIGRWDFDSPAYPLLLREAGYHIGFSYKVWKPGKPANAPHGGEEAAYQVGGNKWNGFSQNMTRMLDNGRPRDEAMEVMRREIRKNFRQFLADRKEGQPFCYWFGPTNVHRKWTKGSAKRIWGMDPDDLKGKMPPFLPDVHLVREDLNDYLGEARAYDMAMGIMMEELKKTGELDNTLIAISGDHGAPGFPYGKCNLYDFGTRVPLLVMGPGVKGGRVVDDLVSLPDLAPTFLEAAGVPVPEVMTARSLWPVLKSEKQGKVDPQRDAVYIGRERHFPTARPDNLPYPQRAIRTHDYLFIINFKPERMPLGDHFRLGTDREPTMEELTKDTSVTIKDEDAGPTKAWIVTNRETPEGKFFFNHAYGPRPKFELYDLSKDPHQMTNVAGESAYAEVVEDLKERLMRELKETEDPRLIDEGVYFENLAKEL
jgi:N-sulfoglucosamine sulfohydrolase